MRFSCRVPKGRRIQRVHWDYVRLFINCTVNTQFVCDACIQCVQSKRNCMSNGNIEFQCGTRCMHAWFREQVWRIERKGNKKRAPQICFGLVLSFLLHNAIRKNVTNITDTISFFFSPSFLLCHCWTSEEKEKNWTRRKKSFLFLSLSFTLAVRPGRYCLKHTLSFGFYAKVCNQFRSFLVVFFPWLVLVFLCIQIWIGDAKQIVIVYEKKIHVKSFSGLSSSSVCVFFVHSDQWTLLTFYCFLAPCASRTLEISIIIWFAWAKTL